MKLDMSQPKQLGDNSRFYTFFYAGHERRDWTIKK